MINNLDFSYEGDLTGRFICFDAYSSEDDFRENMLVHNKIAGHLPVKILEGDNKKYLYEISNKKSLRELAADGKIRASLVRDLLKSLENSFIAGKKYMLSESSYLIHPDTIYYDEFGNIFTVYLPGCVKDVQGQLSDLLEYLMDYIDLGDPGEVYVMYLATAMVKETNCTFSSLYTLIDRGLDAKERPEPAETSPKALPGDNKEVTDKADASSQLNKLAKEVKNQSNNLWKIVLAITFVGIIMYFLL